MSVRINGDLVIGSGRNLVIKGGRVFVDGKDVTPESQNISITIEGSVDKIDVDACDSININGDASNVKTMSGNVKCNDVKGNVSTMSGGVVCGRVKGYMSTMSGNITTVPCKDN